MVQARLPHAARDEFTQACEAAGVTQSQALRGLILAWRALGYDKQALYLLDQIEDED
jgi:hypothetical protein